MKKLICIFILVFSNMAVAQQGYVCVSDLATGFIFDKNLQRWKSANFNVNGEKYLLTKKYGQWEWKGFGQEISLLTCSKDFNEAAYMHCDGVEKVVFNNKNLRFMKFYSVGYVNKGIGGNVEGGDTPAITIGTCSSL